MAEEKSPFTSHLDELRKRIIICIVAVAVGFFGSYFFAEQIFDILIKPLQAELPPDSMFIFTGLPEAFFVYLKLSLFGGILLASPVLLWEVWCFVAPGLYDQEKKYVYPFVIFSTLLFATGVSFGYFVVFPIAFKFFMGYSSEIIKPLPSIKEYLNFSCKLLFAFGVVFELPLFTLFLAKIGLVNEKMLRSKRKFAILGIFAVAAILTPPDVVSQILMAIPLLVLYEISILVAKYFGKKEEEEEEEEENV
ncbi:MAG: twin-arginine translocase subunit TatC [Deltaproteobacteria bacterium]|nr:twin-arginine translocase subunit TatC [Deltaproteobacteria bacterium]NOQ87033.1 twin-arginine translocase subunit TatC [Deltaproteobacteria bacterium]